MRYFVTFRVRWGLPVLVALVVAGVGAGLIGDERVASASHNFSDVPDDRFYHDAVDFMVNNGLTSGCGGGQYCGDDAVTRGQAAQFFRNFAQADADDAGLRFKATLDGAQEVPAVATMTTGEIHARFNPALSEVAVELTINNGVDVTRAHFHCARPGANGPIAFGLFVPGPLTFDNAGAQGTLTNADFSGADCVPNIGRPVNNIAALAFAMRDGLIYLNVHTTANPGGEIRGQLLEDENGLVVN